jgi:hypothetical protein
MPESSLGLQRTVAESDDPKEERVLIISDCKPMLRAIERAWRAGDARGCRGGRAATLEAVCKLRAQLGRVVTVWCPAHRGITPNEYADIAAAAHAQCQVESTDSIIAAVTSRDCRRGFCRRDAAQLRGGRRGDGCGGGDWSERG